MKTRTALALAFLAAAVAGACAPKKDTTNPDGATACTEEAKVCPDGSSVSRQGADCEFAACPTDEAAADADAEGEGEPSDAEAPTDEVPAEAE
jgi:hypothetical protein